MDRAKDNGGRGGSGRDTGPTREQQSRNRKRRGQGHQNTQTNKETQTGPARGHKEQQKKANGSRDGTTRGTQQARASIENTQAETNPSRQQTNHRETKQASPGKQYRSPKEEDQKNQQENQLKI